MENLIPKILKIWLLMGSSAGKESTCNVGDLGSIPGLGTSPGKEKALQYFGLENSMDCIVKVTQSCLTHCDCIVHGVSKSLT